MRVNTTGSKSLSKLPSASPSSEELLTLLQRAAEQLRTAQARGDALAEELDLERAEHQETRAVRGQLEAQLSQLYDAQARVPALESRAAELERLLAQGQSSLNSEQEKTAQQEVRLAETLGALDCAQARVAELEALEAQRLSAESALAEEKSRHQATALKLLAERARIRELDGAMARLQQELAAEKAAQASLTEKAVRAEAQHLEVLAAQRELTERVQAELDELNQHSQSVERQFESLHREFALVLAERDEALKQVSSEKLERQRLERAMGQLN